MACLLTRPGQSVSRLKPLGIDRAARLIVRPSGLGHVRLSIIDLATSQQPLSDEEGQIHAVVTGEFYDFEKVREELKQHGAKFQTNGDSELLIQL